MMLLAILGIDSSSPGGLINLAIVAAMGCIVIGFFADCILSGIGFGILGNGVIAVTGMYLTVWLIDHQIARYYTISASGAVICAASTGALLLVGLSMVKRRFL